MDATTKRCTRCGISKPLDDFYRDGDSVKSSCQKCVRYYMNRRNAIRRGEDPSSIREDDDALRPIGRAEHLHTFVMQRDSCIASVLAAARWWSEATEREDRDLATQAAVFRARQLIEAQGRCEA